MKLLFIWLTLIFGFDFFLGSVILDTFYYVPNKIRVTNKIFHHSLKENTKNKEYWGSKSYNLCTNRFGFKISCENDYNENKFDIAFIGDSFTEGVGLRYEDSFVGIIDKALDSLNIANLGVASYSHSIYFSKVKYFIDNGLKFKEVVVYPDISDIQDEAISYELIGDLVTNDSKDLKFYKKIKLYFRWMFPVNYLFLNKVKNYFLDSEMTNNIKRSEWTYKQLSYSYGGIEVNKTIEKSLIIMNRLHDLLKSSNIKLSIGVYPWPSQLKYDVVNSFHVKIWEEFCNEKNIKFYNSFPSFFNLKKKNGLDNVLKKYYNKDGVHFNYEGSKIIANDFLEMRKLKTKDLIF